MSLKITQLKKCGFGLLAAALFSALSLNAQVQNCSLPAGSGGSLSTSQPTICADGSLWAPPTLSGYTAGLTRTEYIFQDPSQIVYNEDSTAFGPKILAINLSGAFNPQAAGLSNGDQFTVTALHYNLSSLQAFAQALLNGSFLFTPCCTFAELVQGIDVCSVYNSIGIFNGSDITNMNVWVASILAFNGADALDNIIYSIDQINVQAGQPCTDALPICYATSSSVTVDIVCATSCSTATPPSGLNSTNLSNRIALSWNPVPLTVACQANANRITPPGPSPSQNIIGAAPSSTQVPYSLLGAGTTWRWRVRCACSISPSVNATAFSVYDTFSVPAAREVEDLSQLDESAMVLSAWPNPATDQLVVESGFGLQGLEVYDALGRLRMSQQPEAWSSSQQVISLHGLEPGIYWLCARFEGGEHAVETLRFVVQ